MNFQSAAPLAIMTVSAATLIARIDARVGVFMKLPL
jgi:hypothetical protein